MTDRPTEPRRYGGLTLDDLRGLRRKTPTERSSAGMCALEALDDLLDRVDALENEVDTLRYLDDEAQIGADAQTAELRQAQAEVTHLTAELAASQAREQTATAAYARQQDAQRQAEALYNQAIEDRDAARAGLAALLDGYVAIPEGMTVEGLRADVQAQAEQLLEERLALDAILDADAAPGARRAAEWYAETIASAVDAARQVVAGRKL